MHVLENSDNPTETLNRILNEYVSQGTYGVVTAV